MTAEVHQRMTALDHANEVRFQRKQLKGDLRDIGRSDGCQLAAALIRRPPEWLETMRCQQLVEAVPSVGPVKTRRLLRVVGVAPFKRLGGLNDRQRAALAALVAVRGRGSVPIPIARGPVGARS